MCPSSGKDLWSIYPVCLPKTLLLNKCSTYNLYYKVDWKDMRETVYTIDMQWAEYAPILLVSYIKCSGVGQNEFL